MSDTMNKLNFTMRGFDNLMDFVEGYLDRDGGYVIVKTSTLSLINGEKKEAEFMVEAEKLDYQDLVIERVGNPVQFNVSGEPALRKMMGGLLLGAWNRQFLVWSDSFQANRPKDERGFSVEMVDCAKGESFKFVDLE